MLRSKRPFVINSDSMIGFGLVIFYLVISRNGDLSGNVFLSLALYGFAFIALLTGVCMRRKHIRKNKLLWFITLIPFLYSSPIWLDAALFALGILIVVFVESDTFSLVKVYNAIVFVAIVNAVCVFIQFIDRGFFDRFAQVWYPEGMYQQYLRTMRYGSYLNGCNAIAGDTAGYVMIGIGLIFCFYLTHRGVKSRSNLVLFIFCFGALILTGKRSILLCGLVSGLIIYIISGRASKRFRRFFFALIIVLMLIQSIAFIAELFPGANTIVRIAKSIEGLIYGNDISSGRTRLYGYALIQFRSAPLLGIGWKHFNQLTTTLYSYSAAHYVNNDYLQVLCETGVIGLICIYLPMFVFLIKTIRIYSKSQGLEIKGEAKLALAFSLFVQLMYLLYSIFEIPLYDRAFFFMYILAVVIGYCALNEI